MSILITGGTIVTASDTARADLYIEDDTITVIGANLDQPADEVIDATGMYVMPGAIDMHTHLSMPFGGTITADDFESGTKAAAAGGTTTIIDFAIQPQGASLAETLDIWHEKAAGKAVIDYGFHIAVTDLTDAVLAEVPAIVAGGVPSIKAFMAYKGALMVDDGTLFRLLQTARESGGLVMVHAENGDAIDVLTRQLLAAGKTAPRFHGVSRPPVVEAEATGRAIDLARLAGSPLYVVHVTCAEALARIQEAQARGEPVMAETCTHYLVLDETALASPGFDGAKYVCSPPLRDRSNQAALWAGLRTGALRVVSSDHCSFNLAGQKELGKDNFALIPNGLAGIEERVMLLYAEGVRAGRLDLNRFVDVVSTAPARIFGLYPAKGTIAVGSDADVVVFDPNRERTFSVRQQQQRLDHNAFEGIAVSGAPSVVLSRGRVIVRDNVFVGDIGAGRFLKRSRFAPAVA